eukprot:Opistho-2@7040
MRTKAVFVLAVLAALAGSAVSTAPTSPTSTNLLTWLDAAATNAFQVASDGHIARWVDQSSRGQDFVQSSTSLQPMLNVASSGQVFRRDTTNAYSYYTCDYSCSCYYYQSNAMATSGGSIGSSAYRRRRFTQLLGGLLQPNPVSHIFFVTNTVGLTQSLLGPQFLFELDGATASAKLQIGSFLVSGGRAFGVLINTLTNVALVTNLLGTAPTSSEVWTFTLQPAIGGLTTFVNVYRNGVSQLLSGSILLGTPPMNGPATLGRSFEGRVSEVLVYSDMTSTNRASTTAYLCAKHGVAGC